MLFIIVRKNCRTGRRCVVWILTVTVRRTARSLVIQTAVGLWDRHRRGPTTFLIQVCAKSVNQTLYANGKTYRPIREKRSRKYEQ